MACVRSGIPGWAIGLLIRRRAGAERRAANAGKTRRLLINRPGSSVGFLRARFQRTSTRQQLDCAKTLV